MKTGKSKFSKRLLAMLLTLCMVMSCFTGVVYAEEGETPTAPTGTSAGTGEEGVTAPATPTGTETGATGTESGTGAGGGVTTPTTPTGEEGTGMGEDVTTPTVPTTPTGTETGATGTETGTEAGTGAGVTMPTAPTGGVTGTTPAAGDPPVPEVTVPLSAEATAFIDAVNALDIEAIKAAYDANKAAIAAYDANPEDADLQAKADAATAAFNTAVQPVSAARSDYDNVLSDEDIEKDAVKAANATLEELENYIRGNTLGGVSRATSDFVFAPVGTGNTFVAISTTFKMMDGVSLNVTHQDGSALTAAESAAGYKLVITAVTNDAGYTFNTGDTQFVASGEVGKKYTITYAVQDKNGAAVNDAEGQPITFNRAVETVHEIRTEDLLTTDDEYISNAMVTARTTGLAPFDANDDAGNDSSADNTIVRSFDTLTYTLAVASDPYTAGVYYKEGYVWYEFVLPCTPQEASFDTGSMLWISVDPDHKSTTRTVVKDGKTYQILTAARKLSAPGGTGNALPIASSTVSLEIRVGAAANGAVIAPKAYTWMDHNQVDTTSDVVPVSTCTDAAHLAKNPAGEVVAFDLGDEIKVSAEPRYNVFLRKDTSKQEVVGNFDFSTGNDKAANKGAGTVYGRLTAYGITLQLYNNAPNKGLKGVELPKGPITFDLTFSEKYAGTALDLAGVDSQYTPLVWSYEPNTRNMVQADGRDVGGHYGTSYIAAESAPYNGARDASVPFTVATYEHDTNDCWSGGTWSASQTGATVNFTVDDYIINPRYFPNVASSWQQVIFYPIGSNDIAQMGGFSAGEVFVVVPFGAKDTEDFLPTKKGTDGTIELTLTEGNLAATSVTDKQLPAATGSTDNSNQQAKNDDVAKSSVYISQSGEYSHQIQYGFTTTDTGMDFNNKWEGAAKTGLDCGEENQKGTISWYIMSNPKGEAGNTVARSNSLMKFDPDVVSLTGTMMDPTKNTGGAGGNYYDTPTASVKYLYVAKKDGSTWDNDADMNTTVEGDPRLYYYDSLQALQDAGKICIGILAEYTNPDPLFGSRYVNRAVITVKPGSLGKVGAICVASTIWSKDAVDALGGTVPSRLEVQNSGATMPAATIQDYRVDYVNTQYDADGNRIAGGDTKGNKAGDSLYVVGHKAAITKTIVQKNEANATKTVYDLDGGQNVVDYQLNPKTTIIGGSAYAGSTTTVTIVDTLPAGILFNNDAVYGGTYVAGTPVGSHGTVTGGTKGGETAPDGSTFSYVYDTATNKVTYTITNAPVGKTLPVINYSVTIDVPAATNNQSFKNGAWITTTVDKRGADSKIGNYSAISFQVSKYESLSANKTVAQTFNDNGSDIVYTANWINTNAENEATGQIMMDTMPVNGVGQSSFSGSYVNKGLKLSVSDGRAILGYEVYYTTSDAAKNLKSSDYIGNLGVIQADEIRDHTTTPDKNGVTWTKAEIGEGNSTVTGLPNDMTCWVIIGDLPKGGQLTAEVTIKASGAHASDAFCNRISIKAGAASTTAYIAGREIRGVAWVDRNKDGIHQTTEKILPGLTVKLYKKGDTTVYKNFSGDDCVTTTDENGAYTFKNLEAGEYVVEFSSGATVLPGTYFLSPYTKNEDFTDSTNSDAQAKAGTDGTDTDGTIKVAQVTGLKTPTAAEMNTNPYRIMNVDAGFYTSEPVPIQVTLGGNKLLTNKDTGADLTATIVKDQFKFDLSDKNKTEDAGKYTMPTTTTVGTTAGSGAFTFGEIELNEAGTYTFQIAEKASTTTAYTNDAKPVTATVTVTREPNTEVGSTEKWKLVPVITYTKDGAPLAATDPLFRNTYNPPTAIAVDFAANKTLMNYDGTSAQSELTASQFAFKVVADAANIVNYTNEDGTEFTGFTANNKANGAISFGKIKFTAPGLYRFTVSETSADTKFIAVDTKPVTVGVNVTRVEATNALSATVTYSKDSKVVADAQLVNTKIAPTEVKAKLSGTKALEDDDGNTLVVPAGYSFSIAAGEGNPTDGAILPTTTTVQNVAGGAFSFDDITFKKPGNYSFTISEKQEVKAGYTYDVKAVTASVSVTVNTNNELVVGTWSYVKDSADQTSISFGNVYTNPAPITVPIGATKVLNNADGNPITMEANQFSFTLAKDAGNPTTGADETSLLTAANNTAAGAVSFGSVAYSKPGTYVYTISETNTSQAGMTYDNKPVTVTVDVALNTDDNTLVPTVTYEKDGNPVTAAGFTNQLADPDPVEATFTGKKTLKDYNDQGVLIGDKAITNGQFTFTITMDTPDTSVTGYTTTKGSVNVDKSITFPAVTFSKPGEYTFTISEDNGGAVGYTYDSVPVKATVKVTLNKTTNKLEIATDGGVTYTKNGVAQDGANYGVNYDNKYQKPLPHEIKLQAGKTLKDADGNAVTFPAEKFVVTLKPKAGTPTTGYGTEEGTYNGIGTGLTAKVSATGSFEFPSLYFTYDEHGTATQTYTFEMEETNGGLAAYGYDITKHTIVVSLDGTTTADSTGRLQYQATYTIDGTDPTVTPTAITFNNTKNTPTKTTATLEITKELYETGTTKKLALTANQFEFRAVPSTTVFTTGGCSYTGGTAKNAADGKVKFENIEFTKPGTYEFAITETGTAPAGYTYSTQTVTAHVEVTLNETTNALSAVTTYKVGDTATTTPTLKNEYTLPEAVGVALSGSKTLKDLVDNSMISVPANTFKVTLADAAANGNTTTDPKYTMPTDKTVYVQDTGNFSFADITFNKAGTYNFTVKEETPTDVRYSVDTTTYNVKVEVALNTATNAFGTTVTITGGTTAALNFANTKKVPDPVSVTPVATKNLTNSATNAKLPISAFQFAFNMSAQSAATAYYSGLNTADVNVPANASGTSEVTFSALTFTKAGTYTFTIHEKNNGAAGYTYDDTKYTMKVVVTESVASGAFKLEANTTYTKQGVLLPQATEAVLNNTYTDPVPVDGKIDGVKTLKDETGNPVAITANKFTVNAVADVTNDTAGYTGFVSTATVGTDGKFDFGDMKFSKVGTYKFTVTETKLADPNYKYDETKWLVTFTVTLNAATNVFEITRKVETVAADSSLTDAANTIGVANVYAPVVLPKKEYAAATGVNGATVGIGEVISYKLTWANPTSQTQTLTLVDTLSKGLAYNNDADTAPTSVSGQKLTWTLADVVPGAFGTITYTATTTDEAMNVVSNDYTVQYDKTNDKYETTLKNPKPFKQIALDSAAGKDNAGVKVGDVITYNIGYANESGVDALVVIKDTMSAGLAYNGNAADSNGAAITATNAGNAYTWSFTVAPGKSGLITYTATVTEAAKAQGKVENSATIQIGGDPEMTLETQRNPVDEKTYNSTTVGLGTAIPVGANVPYKISFNNVKDSAVTVTIQDSMSRGLTYKHDATLYCLDATGADISGTITAVEKAVDTNFLTGTTTVTWEVKNVPAGAKGYLIYDAYANGAVVGNVVRNSAAIKYGDGPYTALNALENNVPKNVEDHPGSGDNNGSTGTSTGTGTSTNTRTITSTTTVLTIPKTGDETPLGLLLGLLAIGAVGFVSLVLLRKRRNGKQ